MLVDADPQGDLTTYMGYFEENIKITLVTLIDRSINDKESILNHKEHAVLIPSNLDLSALEFLLVNEMSQGNIMKFCLNQVKENYDYILIDCMPSLGIITINALSSADSVIIPVQAQYLAAKRMEQFLNSIAKVKKQINPNLN